MKTLSLFLATLLTTLSAGESITGHFAGYRSICAQAAVNTEVFNNFRSMGQYRIVLELENGSAFADYVASSDRLMANLETYRTLDTIGNPPLEHFEQVGDFTSTTLRYIVLADQMHKLFNLPDDATLAEIGAGFGGQCYILSHFKPFGRYYIYDLPEVELLIDRVASTLNVPHVMCQPINSPMQESKIDLVISNYAFSECDREMQMHYFNQVIKKADRGYIIYNEISESFYGIKSLSVDEFVSLLRKEGFRPRVHHEFLSTAPNNMLIVWDNTKTKGK